ncbi:MAG: fibrobacter succinogenes major paralogous domain-containing protein [Chitinophagaceae bacterium]
MKHCLLIFMAFMVVTGCKKDKKSLAVVTTTNVTSITGTNAQTGGTINDDGGSGITQRGVCWADHAGPSITDSITKESGSNTFTSSLSGLNAKTTYYVRAYAVNASGTAYGNEVSFSTAAGLPTVTTTTPTDIVALSAKSGGNITNDGGASITERGTVFATTANPTTANFKVAAGTGTGSFTVSMSPLASQTTYYVRAYAINNYGTSYGKQVQFNSASANTVTDVDGNVYPYATIGAQNWMTRNLKVTKYKNGDPITNGMTNFNWETSKIGAYAFPNANVNKKDTLGLLYSFYAIKDTRGVCPTGWHIPTDNDWKVLEVNQGMTQIVADQTQDYPGRGTIGAKFLEGGTSGLEIQKAGYGYIGGPTPDYYGYNEQGGYWNSTPGSSDPVNTIGWRGFNFGDPDHGPIIRGVVDNTYILSIRCIKD